MDRERTHAVFVAWLCRQLPGMDSPDLDAAARMTSDVLVALADDPAPLPAQARFCIPGGHAPTHGHAARLMGWALDTGLVSNLASLPQGLADVPGCLLADADRRIDDEMRAEGRVVGATPAS